MDSSLRWSDNPMDFRHTIIHYSDGKVTLDFTFVIPAQAGVYIELAQKNHIRLINGFQLTTI